MIYTSQQLGKELDQQLKMGYNLQRLSNWARDIYFDHKLTISSETRAVLEVLYTMNENPPQFEYSEKELIVLSEMLLQNVKDPIKKINGQ